MGLLDDMWGDMLGTSKTPDQKESEHSYGEGRKAGYQGGIIDDAAEDLGNLLVPPALQPSNQAARSAGYEQGRQDRWKREPASIAPGSSHHYGSAAARGANEPYRSASTDSGAKKSVFPKVLLLLVVLVALPEAVRIIRHLATTAQGVTRPLAEQAIPAELNQIYAALDSGHPRDAAAFLSSELLNSNQSIDYLCQPFTHRAHYVSSIVERPDNAFLARVRVLFKPLAERAYVLSFRAIGSHYVLVRAENDPFTLETAAARETVRQFIYAVRAGKWDVAARYSSLHLPLAEFEDDPDGQQYFTKITEVNTDHVYDVSIETGHAITLMVHATVSTFEFPEFRIDPASGAIIGAFFKSTWMNLSSLPHGGRGVNDSHVDRDTLARFGLVTGPEWSRTVALDLAPVHSLADLKWPNIPVSLWVSGIELLEDRTVVLLTCSCVADDDTCALLSPCKRLDHRPGVLIPIPDHDADYQDAYVTDQEGRVAAFAKTSLDFKPWPGTVWYYHEIRLHEKRRFTMEFQAVTKNTTNLKLYHRQFGTIDIPLDANNPPPAAPTDAGSDGHR